MSAVLTENKPRRPIVDPWQPASPSTTASTSTTRPRQPIRDPWAAESTQPAKARQPINDPWATDSGKVASEVSTGNPQKKDAPRPILRTVVDGARRAINPLSALTEGTEIGRDLSRLGGGGMLTGTGRAIEGIERSVADAFREPMPGRVRFLDENNRPAPLTERQQEQARAWAERNPAYQPSEFSQALKRTGEGIQQDVSPTMKQAMQDSELGGDILSPSTWTLGDDPSARGLLGQVTKVGGEMIPIVAAGAVPGVGPGLAVTAAAGQSASGAYEDASDYVLNAPRRELEQSPRYRELIGAGLSEDAARSVLADEAGRGASGPAAAIGGLSGAILSGAATRPLQQAIANRMGNTFGARMLGNAVEMPLEGLQEVGESVAGRFGANQSTGLDRDLTEGTFGDFVLGAAAAGPAAVLHSVAGGERGAAPGDTPQPEQAELLALPPPGSDPIVVTPDGTAYTAQQREALGITSDVLAAQRQRQQSQPAGNTAPFPGATPGTLADAANAIPQAPPVLSDGSPAPDPAGGPLSRAVNQGVVNGGIPTGPRTWEQMQANITLDAEQARADARREREMDSIARDSRLPAALFDAERDAALREATGQNAVESSPSAMQLAMQRAQRERPADARPPINDPWAGDVQGANLRFASESRAFALPRSENAAVEATQGFDVSNAETPAPAVRFEPKGEKGLLVHGDHAAIRERLAAAGFRKKGRNQDGALRFDAKDRPALEAALSDGSQVRFETGDGDSLATPANTTPAIGTRPPIRDPWASPDSDLGEQYARGRVREGTSMGIPVDPATGRPEITPKGGISNAPPAIAPLAAPVIPPWSNSTTGETTTPTPALIRTAVEQQVAAQYQHNGRTALNSTVLARAWGVPQKDIARIAREVRANFTPASTSTATHIEPGQSPQPTTPASAQTVTRAEAETLDVKEVAQFSRTSTTEDQPTGPGLPVENVQRIVNDFQRQYRGNIPLQVRVGATVNDLYGVGADQLESLRSFKGAYHPRRGIVALAADRLSSRADVEATLRHEVLGHYGLNTLAPADKAAILEAILSSRTEPSLTQLWAQTDALYADMPDLVRAEEVFAELAGRERGTLGQWWDRVLVLLAKALRNVGLLRGGTSRAELHDLARRIGEGIRSRERTQQTFPASDQEQFSRADPIGSPAFRHWFGDSQVTDANGAPRVVYHGTASDFWAFDAARLGENTGHLTAPLGFFFTENRAEAQRYAEKASEGVPADERLIDVHLSIQNPKAMTLEQFHAIDSFDQARAVREQLQRQGHDGIRLTSNGRSQWIAFVPTQAKSASQNRGSFNPADPDIRFSRAAAPQSDPFAEENRRLREQDKSIWKKAGQILRREFAPGGLLPEQVFGEKIARDSNFQAVEFDVRHLAGTLEKAVRQDFGKALDRLPEAKQRQLGEALAGKVSDTLPPETRAALVAMRQYIDALSSEYLGIIQNRIDTLAERAASTGRDADAARALDEVGLYEKIRANIGQYVHRSYRAFDDPQWFKKVPTDVLNAARRYLGEGYLEQGSSPAEARRLADVAINEILKNGTAYDSMEAFVAEGKLGAKDLSVLMRRKDVPPEIRALLGEYTDPRVNFAKSATKMGRLIWNQRFLDRVREMGLGSFLFEDRDRPASATAQLAAEGSDTLAPLNGLWTFPEVAQAFKDALGKEQMGSLYRAIVRMNGMVKYGKTVLSPTTAMRNWQSAMFFSLANGHFDLREAKKGWIAFREQVAQNAKGDELAYLRRLKELGVVYDAPYAGEMARYIQDARLEELLEGKSGKALHLLRKMNQTAQGFYSFGDDFWKIIGFENEKAALVKAGIPAGQAETMAAERIRNTYPTYSMVGRGVKWLSRFPLVGTFVSFPAEIVRTTANMLQLTAADLKSDNPGIRAIGRKRAAGMALVSAGFYALSAITRAMFGVGDDEEEALRDLAPPWQKNSTFLYTGRDAKGQLRYFDMSFLDPYGYWKRPITAMMRDRPWEDSAASAAGDMLGPFLGTDISAGAIFEVMANKKGSGGRVYSPNADPLDQTTDIANHLRKALQPGFVGNAERLVLAAKGTRRKGSGQPYDMRDEVVSLLGWRASTLDTKTALYYRSFEFTDALAAARQELTRTLRSSNPVSRQDIQRSRAEAERQYGDAFRQMHRLVASARAAGMTRPQIARTLRLSGVSAESTQALIAGRTPPMRIGTQSARNAVQQARTMQGPAQAREVAQRFREAGAR